MSASVSQNRAERFEDEKRRIVDSVFSRRDANGDLVESYITHVRIAEDAAYPSNPPPPNSNPDAKKFRVIIVAVKKSGRVLMHKARENANKTFSIGKTWPLDDLATIESFTNAVATTPEEQQRKQWAGEKGFIVTIGKPYYWEANSEKEKQFFIASLVKIYTKYTQGKTPTLAGFDEKERASLLGLPVSRPAVRAAPAAEPFSSQAVPRQGERRPVRRPPSRGSSRADNGTLEQMPRSAGNGLPMRREASTRSNNTTDPDISQEPPIRRSTSNTQSQDSFQRGDDESLPLRTRSRVEPASRMRDNTAEVSALMHPAADRGLAGARSVQGSPQIPAPLNLAERRGPQTQENAMSNSSHGRSIDDNLIPAPLMSPVVRKDELSIPIRSGERPATPLTTDSRPSTARTPEPSSSPSTSSSFFSKIEGSSTITKAKSPLSPPVPDIPEDTRPGLGPMIRKKLSKGDVASAFRKAATAGGAFKPRAGGAAERLREAAFRSTREPDGISGVVPAPSLSRAASESSTVSFQAPTIASTEAMGAGPVIPPVTTPLEISSVPPTTSDTLPEVMITKAPAEVSQRPALATESDQPSTTGGIAPEADVREARRKNPASERTQRELRNLGVDPVILDGRCADFVNLLDQFGWSGEGVHTRNIDEMREDIEREINKVQVGGWLTRLDEEDERIAAIGTGIDNVIEQAEALEGLLTLYSVELGTMADDVAFIEAQSQGLQVQAANQKLLQAELQSLLDTISISPEQLQSLKEASIESSRGLQQIESSLILLYKAMATIDPSLSLTTSRNQASRDGSVRSGQVGFGDSDMGNMRVLQEKKDTYRSESMLFLNRLKDFLKVKFSYAFAETQQAIGPLERRPTKGKIDVYNHMLTWKSLAKYSPLMLFSREVDKMEWEQILRMYENTARPINQEEFRNALSSWAKTQRKPLGDEQELFTSQVEKQEQGLGRKLTVRAPQSLNKLKSMGDLSGRSTNDRSGDNRTQTHLIFTQALEEMCAVIVSEQNFITEFFHITSLATQDFVDLVLATPSDQRQFGDLNRKRPMDPNRELARKVVQSMEELYAFWPKDMQDFVQWCVELDPTQGVGVLAALERRMAELEESNQEYLSRALQRLHQQLLQRFGTFLGDQCRAITDTRVKIKKRKGVISFIRVFPSFTDNIEGQLVGAEDLDIRQTIDAAYNRIIRGMFDSLKVIAKEGPSQATSGTSLADPEAKEALNHQILLIENMHHYIEEVNTRRNAVLEDWKDKAEQELKEHLDLYINAIVRRPLGKLLDMLESTESRISTLPPGSLPSTIANNQSHSRTKFKALLAVHDTKEIRNGIEALKSRVVKHFSHQDEPNAGGKLVGLVLRECEAYYAMLEKRITNVSADVYEGDAPFEWASAEVVAAFRR